MRGREGAPPGNGLREKKGDRDIRTKIRTAWRSGALGQGKQLYNILF